LNSVLFLSDQVVLCQVFKVPLAIGLRKLEVIHF